jgi:Icc protein
VTTIAHISDTHVGSPHFVPNLMNRVIAEVNELKPDLVIHTGDITNEGFRGEYKTAAAYLEQIEARLVAVPGNHDARNVGYVHFEELIGPRHWRTSLPGVTIVGADSSEPDLNEGQVGRERYPWIIDQFEDAVDLKIYVHHHHLLPIPGTGRERSTVADAGDLLEVLIRAGVNLCLTGHKHVPYVWRLEDLYIANAGTCASLRVRGHTRPAYNLIEWNDGELKITQKHPFGPSNVLAHFDLRTGRQYYRELEPLMTESHTTP